jgi:AcrR family transcriptional regulator
MIYDGETMAGKARSSNTGKAGGKPGPEAILDAALGLAQTRGWAGTSLAQVARALDVSLADIRAHFRDKDALANAWFERALAAMLAPGPDGFAALPVEERIVESLRIWFAVLSTHRRATRDMFLAKLYPGHPHHWVPLVFDLSRFVHWLLDAADLNSPPPRRQLEEVALTALVVSAHMVWLSDPTAEGRLADAFLGRALRRGGRLFARLPLPGREMD